MSRTSQTPTSSTPSSSPSSSVALLPPGPLPSPVSSPFSSFSSPSPCPPARAVPVFPPLRVGRGGGRLRRALRRRRRPAAAALAVAAAALAVAGGPQAQASRGGGPPAKEPPPPPVRMVSAPVRIADAATVRLLRPGDRVDVVAAERAGPPRVVAEGARVDAVPGREEDAGGGGALVVLSVPRDTARDLVGAGAVAQLAVTLC
ncbi:hypothetical protein ACFV7Q_18255 [Streptomyces sp. NPDC059851]|uniref:hypothetical protein n=1 Tax=Streptomyces sp. NPDC059851 TaxID=3346971 RepID=UPI003662FC07